jgi:microcystin-dependent protein
MKNMQVAAVVLGSLVGGAIVQVVVSACGNVSTKVPDAHADAVPATVTTSGTIVAFAGQTAPDGWLLCDGGEVSRAANPALFSVIGTLYGGGDAISTFNVPDLRGRTVIGVGMGGGLSMRALAQMGGEEQHTLTVAEMPSHTHREQGSNRLDGANGGAIHYQDVDTTAFGPVVTAATGGGQPHNSMPPFVALNYIIKI